MLVALACLGLLLAALPATMFLRNLPLFLLPNPVEPNEIAAASESEAPAAVSVLIPARDEERGIRRCLETVLDSRDVVVEAIVLDDHSSDQTASIVQSLSATDDRVRCLHGRELPAGWNGKQHACSQLAEAASYDRMLFLDADVRLERNALATLIKLQDDSQVALLSAFPRQQTGSFLESLIIPLIHYVLLGFLPMERMRSSAHPAYASGCGQLFLTRQTDYRKAGTHAAIRGSRHDGLKLPRAYRMAGQMTDVVDGTGLAACRMYSGAGEVIRGVLKNAIEGIAHPRLIGPFTILLLGANVLPIVLLAVSVAVGNPVAIVISGVGVFISHLPRAVAARRFRQPVLGVLFHGLAVLLFVLLQWVALFNHLTGRQIAWRGRIESLDQTAETT